MTVTPSQRARLAALGFNPAEITALDHLWVNDAFADLLLDGDAHLLRHHGYGPAECADAFHHDIDGNLALGFLDTGFTVHQAALVLTHDRPEENLRPHLLAAGAPHPFLHNVAPRTFVVNMLWAANNHNEARRYMYRWLNANIGRPTEAGDSAQSIEDEVAMLAAYQIPADLPCQCP